MSRLKVTLGALVLAATMPPSAVAQAPPGPPGPPPGNGTELPAPPGTAPPFVPPGTASAVPAGASGPVWLDAGRRDVQPRTRSFVLRSPARRTGPPASPRAAGKGRWTRRATVARAIGRRALQRVAQGREPDRAPQGPGRARHRQAERTHDVARLQPRVGKGAAPGGGSGPTGICSARPTADARGYLVEPDFTTATPTRSPPAAGSPGTRRRRLALARQRGRERGRWNTWTATVTGVEQFHPNGADGPDAVHLGPDRGARPA